MQFHSYFMATDGVPTPRGRRTGRRRHHPGDGAPQRSRLPRLRRKTVAYPGIPSLLRP